jgi:hypothetical protein
MELTEKFLQISRRDLALPAKQLICKMQLISTITPLLD